MQNNDAIIQLSNGLISGSFKFISKFKTLRVVTYIHIIWSINSEWPFNWVNHAYAVGATGGSFNFQMFLGTVGGIQSWGSFSFSHEARRKSR